MAKYRKKSLIEAFQFEAMYPELDIPIRYDVNGYSVYDKLHDNWINFEVGDYIAQGVRGEYWAIKKDVFEETYEKVDE